MPKFTSSLNLPRYATPPASPADGDVYYNTADSKVYSRINGAWVDLAAGGGSGNVVYYQTTAPATGNDGDIWIDSDDETVTATGPQGPTGPAGAAADYVFTQNAQTGTTYTLVLADANKLVEMNNASANTLTVPTNANVEFSVGQQIHLLQTGAGKTTVAAASGVTINAALGLRLRAQWSGATLVKRATNTWVLIGDCEA
jgi:hypothetical protein